MKADPFKNNLGYMLRRASTASMARLAEQFATLELRPTEASVLLVIEANPRIRQSEVGRMLAIRSANMAPLVARLDDRQLIEREPVDGRSHGLRLSPAGETLVAQIKSEIEAHEKAIHDVIPTGQEEAFTKIAKAIWKTMEG
ncbi:MarR family winged helix-turn-helix transcriptional regulator [Maricaulis parjimensis]|uniref:MarR family winged helix-turn-helix transcriptional regulator n=1 Tax=Maricaulis parjimensis TaxID=144023 RepID=UPI00193A6B04|nr:MarR family winged helix-turn-helix transcriptional regulator [Maricaulis parjimensis]